MAQRAADRLNLPDTLRDYIHKVHVLRDPTAIAAYAQANLGDVLKPLQPFLKNLTVEERTVAYKGCLLLYFASKSEMVPRQMQLEALLPVLARKDSMVNAGTGSGKTICMVLAALSKPDAITLVITPLKRLQMNQVTQFEKFGIRAMCLNSDTPNDPELWKRVEKGYYSVLLVSPESLDNSTTHNRDAPRVGRIFRTARGFSKRVHAVLIDEAQHIYTDGVSHSGRKPHRPSYGKLALLRVFLEKGVPFQALSGTLPPHIQSSISRSLKLVSHVLITTSSNRPNLAFATHPVVASLRNLKVYDFLVNVKSKGILFIDDRKLAQVIVSYLDNHPDWPASLRGHVVREYHSSMSVPFLQKWYANFCDESGSVRILVATAGVSEGIDAAVVRWVVQGGVCRNIPDTRQRAGRAGRDGKSLSLFLTLYEDWAMTTDASGRARNPDDPDEPLCFLDKKAQKRDEIGRSIFDFIQSSQCMRIFLKNYFNDNTLEALAYEKWCCDRHRDDPIDLLTWFQSLPLTQEDMEAAAAAAKAEKKSERKKYPRVRKMKDREPLIRRLRVWRSSVYATHPFRGLRTEGSILSEAGMKAIARIQPKRVSCAMILEVLVETDDLTDEWKDGWAVLLVSIIHTHDNESTADMEGIDVGDEPETEEDIPLAQMLRAR